ncbi:MAG: excinuclease ABC subunit UvrC [Oscillospiraceae bacterium]|nr:excinuclease ABC subunit UvrC [Oscillospiraceae bacterium]
MKNSDGEIIYVGKAVNLKNRVKQYFQSNQNHSPKVRAMTPRIASFEYIVTDSEYEALLLECNLIKKNRPKYNVLLKDDKHYPFIKVTVQEEYPRVLSARRVTDDGARYFGPYLNTHSIYDTIHELRKVFPIKNCKRELPRDIGKERPCLNYHIGLCMGPCTGDVDPADYRAAIRDICLFLEGRHDDIVKRLEGDMSAASEDMRFELAGKIRDRLYALRHIQEKQKVLSAADYDQDVVAGHTDNIDTCLSIFFIRGGKLIGKEQFLFEGSGEADVPSLLAEFIKQFYVRAAFIPNEILLQQPIEDLGLIESMLAELKGGKVDVRVPVRGEKRSLIQFAIKNSEIELANKRESIRAEEGRIRAGLAELGEILGLAPDEGSCARIEAFDVSNYGTADKVASMIVFDEGRANKNAYKRFLLRTVEGQDDYACMQEALRRRLRNLIERKDRFASRPDVLLVDGGKGHVSAAAAVLDELGLDIPLAGMAKNERHETSELITGEGEAIQLAGRPELYRLISAIQDEAHRFAIAYSKKLSEKRLSMSALDEIRGVGKKRKMALIAHFKSFKNIRAADAEALAGAPGIDAKTAAAIYDHFHNAQDAEQ